MVSQNDISEQEKPPEEYRSLDDLQRRLGYRFHRPDLLRQALTHRSYAVERGPDSQDNERLEFLGDAVLELVISHLLFKYHGGEYREGELTRMRAFLVREGQLADQARKLEMGGDLLLGKGETKSGGPEKSSILADAFEAVMGAMYLDGGLEEALRFIERCFGSLLEEVAETGLERDYKSTLQELTQGKFHAVPVYEIEEINGPDHERTFTVALYFQGEVVSRGKGRSKKEAEQGAARRALDVIAQ
jgi:ribonuclease-3